MIRTYVADILARSRLVPASILRTSLLRSAVTLGFLSLMFAGALSAGNPPDGGVNAASSPAAWDGTSVVRTVNLKSGNRQNPNAINAQVGVLFDIVNRTRRQAGLPELAWDDKLAGAARDHARAMADTGVLSHQLQGEGPLIVRLTAHNVRLDRASENVVYDISVEGAHDNFMSSPPHRANILDPAFDAVGIGIVEAGGVLYITEDFAHRVADLSDEQASQIAANAFRDLRRTAGADDLALITTPGLRQVTEAMAQREVPDGKPGLMLAGARFSASYATSNPSQIPPSIAQLAVLQGITHYSVAACYARTPKYPGGLYWVTIVLFHSPPQLRAAR